MTRGEYVFKRYSDWADLRGAGRGCGSHDSTENMGAWNKGRASHRNGFFYSGLYLCGNRSFWSDHNFRFSSAIPGGYSSGGRNHGPVYGNPAAIPKRRGSGSPGSVGKGTDVSFFFCGRDYESGGNPDLSVCLFLVWHCR